MNNKSLAVQSNAKFLGAILDESLTYQEHFHHFNEKLQYALIFMRFAGKYLVQKTIMNFYYLFFTLILSMELSFGAMRILHKRTRF